MMAATAWSPRSAWVSVRKWVGGMTPDASGSTAGEMLLDLHDGLGRVGGFRVAVILVEVKHERMVADGARVGRVEIVGEVGLQPGPVGHEVLIVRIEADAFGQNRAGKVLLAADDPVGVNDDWIDERCVVGRVAVGLAY